MVITDLAVARLLLLQWRVSRPQIYLSNPDNRAWNADSLNGNDLERWYGSGIPSNLICECRGPTLISGEVYTMTTHFLDHLAIRVKLCTLVGLLNEPVDAVISRALLYTGQTPEGLARTYAKEYRSLRAEFHRCLMCQNCRRASPIILSAHQEHLHDTKCHGNPVVRSLCQPPTDRHRVSATTRYGKQHRRVAA